MDPRSDGAAAYLTSESSTSINNQDIEVNCTFATAKLGIFCKYFIFINIIS